MKKLEELKLKIEDAIKHNSGECVEMPYLTDDVCELDELLPLVTVLIKAVEALERIQANPLGSNMDDAIARQALEAIEKQIEKEE